MKKSLVIFMLLPFFVGIAAQIVHVIGYKAPQDSTLQRISFVPENYQFQEGDTVIINESCIQYLTGEKPSQWVYGVRHIVGKVGGKRFHDGILLDNICTWIDPQNLKLEHRRSSEAPAQTVTPVSEVVDTPVVKEETPVVPVVVPVAKEDTPVVKEEIPVVPVVVPVAKEDTPVVKEETPVVPVVVPVAKEDTPVVKEETPVVPVVVPVAKADTPVVQEDDVIQTDTTKANPQIDRFTIGVRAGVASFLQKTSLDAQRQLGCNALLDLQYAHYWVRKNDNKFGLLVGLSAGYVQGGLKSGISQQNYTVQDPDGWKAEYTTKVDKIRETDRQIQLEIPLMFSMITTHGFFLNVGPRFLLPVYTPYSQKIENPDIRAYFEKTDVEVRNEVITGLMNEDELKSSGKTKNAFKLNITIGLELGYEWQFKNNQSLGLGAYVNYGVYSMFKNDTETATPFIEVTPAIPSVVSSESTVDSWTKKMGYVDGGIKIAYHFNWKK